MNKIINKNKIMIKIINKKEIKIMINKIGIMIKNTHNRNMIKKINRLIKQNLFNPNFSIKIDYNKIKKIKTKNLIKKYPNKKFNKINNNNNKLFKMIQYI
jgi:hypothetical protein